MLCVLCVLCMLCMLVPSVQAQAANATLHLQPTDTQRHSEAQARNERDQMRALAHTDGMTGLLNRRGLEDRMPMLLAQRLFHHNVALYLLDLDGFKDVNDTQGHDTGDALLRGVALRLQDSMHAPHLVCRLSGDEFVVVVVCELASATDASAVGLKLLRAFDPPVPLLGTASQDARQHPQGITIGYALAPQDAQSLNGLLSCADAGLYVGKQAGKHCVHLGSRGGLHQGVEQPLLEA